VSNDYRGNPILIVVGLVVFILVIAWVWQYGLNPEEGPGWEEPVIEISPDPEGGQ
jgi:hypothetical protein